MLHILAMRLDSQYRSFKSNHRLLRVHISNPIPIMHKLSLIKLKSTQVLWLRKHSTILAIATPITVKCCIVIKIVHSQKLWIGWELIYVVRDIHDIAITQHLAFAFCERYFQKNKCYTWRNYRYQSFLANEVSRIGRHAITSNTFIRRYSDISSLCGLLNRT